MEQLCDSLKAVTLIIESNPEILNSKDSFLFVAASVYVRILLVLACFYKRTKEAELKYEESQEKILGVLDWTTRSYKLFIHFIICVYLFLLFKQIIGRRKPESISWRSYFFRRCLH